MILVELRSPRFSYWEAFAGAGATIALKAQEGRSPELGGMFFHGLSCLARARPASNAARIWTGSNASTSVPIFTLSGIETMLNEYPFSFVPKQDLVSAVCIDCSIITLIVVAAILPRARTRA